ncbi:MAG: twitching motility protein PilT [Acidobacteria bacterium]|nr:twitching motility protein PilT [Acidobacteriota bacterium]
MNFVYDATVLVAADRNDRRCWAEHKARLELGFLPLVPAPVVAQASRSPQQAQLRRFLAGCVVVALGESDAHEAGRLLGRTRTADVVDAVVVTVAVRHKAVILTSDPVDMKRLVRASAGEAAVLAGLERPAAARIGRPTRRRNVQTPAGGEAAIVAV